MIERETQVQANDGRLAGTICLPTEAGLFPTVLMVHGSGPLDRDENMKGQALNVFNAVAHRLAKSGIASVRFDKRGCGASEGDYKAAGHHDLVDDVLSWHDSIREAEFCKPERLFLLGHSEGCLVAAQVATRRPETAGLVLLCPFVEPMENILIRQAQQIERELAASTGMSRVTHALLAWVFGGPVARQQTLIRKLKSSSSASVRVGLERVPAKWLRELLSVDASQVFGRVTCAMLLVGGSKDLQCDPADVSRIASLGQGRADQHIISRMTHVLRCDDEPPTLLGSHRLLTEPVDAGLLDLVADWLSARVS